MFLWMKCIDGNCVFVNEVYWWKLCFCEWSVLMEIVFLWMKCIDGNYVFVNEVYWWKLCFCECSVLMEIMFLWMECIDGNYVFKLSITQKPSNFKHKEYLDNEKNVSFLLWWRVLKIWKNWSMNVVNRTLDLNHIVWGRYEVLLF